ncbi:MAG: MqnA/MqnD/SBP family protein [Candidatus Caenarcaniphilales bacterium]|nr:MqnA/MqnD/SBP family protein [Candidatus Caenarcaniphilales bacterium]
MKITLAHSPDADDAFMFYALAEGKLKKAGKYEFEHILTDIQTLSHYAIESPLYDLTAISYHAYAYACKNYALTRCGSSFGENYGPVLIIKSCDQEQAELFLEKIKLGETPVAVPGLMTSAYLSLKLFAPQAKVVECSFEQIQDRVQDGTVEAGLIIHEGQLTYQKEGFRALVDLGEWWAKETLGLPLPLGANVIRRDLPEEVKSDLARILAESIRYSLVHREEALQYALKFGRGLAHREADRFVGMYVNNLTLDLGDIGEKAVRLFLERGYQSGLIPQVPVLDFIKSDPVPTNV